VWSRCVVPVVICFTIVTGALRPPSSLAGAALPSNLTASAVFQAALESMWQSSPTFRRQCRRLSAAPRLRVNLLLEELARRPSSYSARAAMKRQKGVLVSVDIHLTRLDDPVELIAHEIEHVVEQLDEIDLEVHVSGGNVWKREDGAFETRRAIEVGRRVAHEMSLAAPVSASHHAQNDLSRRPLRAVTQQEDGSLDAGGPPSGRVSASGHHVVFASYSPLVPADGNTTRDIYVMDVATRRVTLETPGAGGRLANGESMNPDISRDGRYVVFESVAGNLTEVEFDRGIRHVFLRDRHTGVTRLLSTNASGEPANGPSMNPSISADGETVAFTSSAGDLLADASMPGGSIGVYLMRLASKERIRVDVTSQGHVRSGQSAFPAVSGDGRYVAFMSRADLTCRDRSCRAEDAPDGNEVFDIYVHDTVRRHTRRASPGDSRRDSDGPSYHPAISGDGRLVGFVSEASNLTHGGTKRVAQIYLRNMETGTTALISHAPAGRPANARSARPFVSGDGSVIAYQSLASNLLCEGTCGPSESDINLLWDVYVYDRAAGRTIRASSDAHDGWMESSRGPSLDETGSLLSLASRHPNSPRDEANDEVLFVLHLASR
jgi:TolB protein